MSALAERAAKIAAKARQVPKPADLLDRSLRREWWTVHRNGQATEVFFCPAQPWDEVKAWYPDAEVCPA